MADLARWDLRGPVRSVEVRRTFGDKSDHAIVEFRPDGAVTRHWHQYHNGSETTEAFIYDAAGKLTTRHFENSSGDRSLWIYEYDPLDRIVRKFSRDASGQEHTTDSYTYDARGCMTKIHNAPRANHYGYSFDGKTFYSGPNAATITTVHDAAGRPAQMLFHDANGALVSRVDFQYDEAGNLIEETQNHTVSPFAAYFQELKPEHCQAIESRLAGPMTRSRHRYDALGRRTETLRTLFGSLGNERVTMEYNALGDLIAQISEDDSREYGADDAGQPVDRAGPHTYSETRFLYEYDSHANWTSKIVQVRSDDHSDFSDSNSERRMIVYYDAL